MGDPIFLTEIPHRVHLILHQSDQRRYHDRGSFH